MDHLNASHDLKAAASDMAQPTQAARHRHLVGSQPKVGVVLLNWNSGEYTLRCIESLLTGKSVPWKVVVVDNASVDDSADLIVRKYPFVQLIRNRVNVGFACGNNQAICNLLTEGADYIWILNNDTLVSGACLYELLQASILFPGVACFTGKIFYENTPGTLWYAGSYRHGMHLAPKHRGLGEADVGRYDQIEEVDFVSGCCMFIPSWALYRFGGFIDEYFAYSEDNEWSWRVRKSGSTLLYVPCAVLWHSVSASLRKHSTEDGISARAYYLMMRNHLWTVRRYAGPGWKKYFAIAVNIAIELRMMLWNLVHGNVGKARAISSGMYEGMRGAIPGDARVFQ